MLAGQGALVVLVVGEFGVVGFDAVEEGVGGGGEERVDGKGEVGEIWVQGGRVSGDFGEGRWDTGGGFGGGGERVQEGG